MLTRAFLSIARRAQSTAATTHVAPLLYDLARSTYAETVVEIGAGYTTLFLLRALADNLADFQRDRAALRQKTRRLLAATTGYRLDARLPEERFRAWMLGAPTYAAPGFYVRRFAPKLLTFDDLSASHPAVLMLPMLVKQLGLADMMDLRPTRVTFKTAAHLGGIGVDLAFNDASEYPEFLRTFAPLVRPGGLMVFHNTLSAFGNDPILEDLRSWNSRRPEQFEILTVLEPHKLFQGSCTILRRVDCHCPLSPVALMCTRRWMTGLLRALAAPGEPRRPGRNYF